MTRAASTGLNAILATGVRQSAQVYLPINDHNEKRHPDNPEVFFDISVNGALAGRVEFELWARKAPHCAENFRRLCTGENGIGPRTKLPLYYKGSKIYASMKRMCLMAGDFENNDGSGGESIYSIEYPDGFPDDEEGLKLANNRQGLLSMEHSYGPDTNNSTFCISLNKMPHRDRQHTVFGQVLRGGALLKRIEKLGNTPFATYSGKTVFLEDFGEEEFLGLLEGSVNRRVMKVKYPDRAL